MLTREDNMMTKIGAALLGWSMLLPAAAQDRPQPDPKETEVWAPVPTRVSPGSPTAAPSDAIVLFGGKDLGEWVSTASPGKPADWIVANGAFTVRAGSGNIQTRRLF